MIFGLLRIKMFLKKCMENKKVKICCVVSVDITLKFMLFGQLKFLRDQGYDVSAICSPGKWVKDIEQEGIRVKTMVIKRKMSPIADLVFLVKMFFYFNKEKFDIVQTHTPKPEIYGQIAAKLAGVPIIIDTLHGFDLSADVPFIGRKVFGFLQKIASKYSSLIFSVSEAVIKSALEGNICQPNLLKYLGRDIDTNRFNPENFSKEFVIKKKKQLGINPFGKVVGIVARMVEEKGYLELFEAFGSVIASFPDAILLIIGQSEPTKRDAIDPEVVKKYNIQNSVIFLGEKSDIEEIYCVMDIFVLPTHREGIGASILEASAMRIPVIATNTGGCPEAINDGETGILVPLKNPKELARAIIALLGNPEKMQKLGMAGRCKILEEFDSGIVFNRLKTEYQRLVNEKLN